MGIAFIRQDERAGAVPPLRDIAVNEDAAGPQHATLLARELGLDVCVIAATWVRGEELRRAEEPAVLNAVERRRRQKVERSRLAQIDTVVDEGLAREVTRIQGDRFSAELEYQTREPWLELR